MSEGKEMITQKRATIDKEKIVRQKVLTYLNQSGDFKTTGDLYNEFYKALFGEENFYSIEEDTICALEFGCELKEMTERRWIRIVEGIPGKDQESSVESCVSEKEFLSFCLKEKIFTSEQAMNYMYQRQCKQDASIVDQEERLNKLEQSNNTYETRISKKIKKQDKKIREFYTNILNILGILIAVFAIIGFNIQGIGKVIDSSNTLSLWNYIGGIAVINICIVLSMYLLFYLINRVINKNKSFKGIFSEKAFCLMLIIFVIIISICFIVA